MKEPNKISPREITPAATYFNRRTFLQTGILAASAVATGLVYRRLNHPAAAKVNTAKIEGLAPAVTNGNDGFRVAGEAPTSLENITHYNNFYEFSTDKEAIAGVVHYYMQTKKDARQPLVFATVLAILLGWRWMEYWRQKKSLKPESNRKGEVLK